MNTDPSTGWASFSEPAVLRDLTEEQRERFGEILDRYLAGLEQSRPLDVDALLREHADLAGPLRMYLDSLDELHQVAAGFVATPPEPEWAGRGDAGPAPDECRMGDFQIVREVGRGGMGVVYEARQISLGRRVALKVLPFAAVVDARQIARFKNEAQAAARLQHPHIVPVYSIGSERGVHFYAMQFVEGEPLSRVLDVLRPPAARLRIPPPNGREDRDATEGLTPFRAAAPLSLAVDAVMAGERNGPVPTLLRRGRARGDDYLAAVMRIGIQVAEALHAAHECGIVHRDIKPSNLLLDAQDKVWVTDFGLARFATDRSLTRSGDVVGTVQYMSPEQAQGRSALVDHRTDIFSLGATLYELLAGQPPLTAPAMPGACGPPGVEPPRLRSVWSDIPRDLETVVHKAIAPACEDRYATARELAEDLQRVLDGQPILARPPTLPDRLTRWARRHRRVAASVALVSCFACAALAVGLLLITREKLRAEQNYERSARYFHEAQDAVDRFGARLAERLAELPGASAVRRDLLQDTLHYYERFIIRAQEDPTLRLELATTYSKMATLAEQIGSTHDALAAHEQSVRLFQQLVRDDPTDVRYPGRLAQSLNNYALTLQRAGRIQPARQAFGEAIHLQQRLVDRFPGSDEYSGSLARFCSNLGLLHAETARSAQAEASLRSAIGWQQKLVDRHPASAGYRRELAATWNNLASLLAPTAPEEAAACYQTALEHESTAAREKPEDLRWRADLALTHNNLGTLLAKGALPQQALARYHDALQIQTELVRLAPDEKSFRHDLAVTWNNLGMLHSQLGRLSDAEQSLRSALTHQQPLVSRDPHDVALRSSLGGVFNNLGMVLERMDRREEASEAFREAVEQQRVACQRAPEIARYRSFLNKHLFNYGRVLRALGNPQQALRITLERRALWPNDAERLLSVAEELVRHGEEGTRTSGKSPPIAADTTAPTAPPPLDLALETLEWSVRAGASPKLIATTTAFHVFQGNPRFARLTGGKPDGP